ncbi:MAG: large subunit ribosomal protein L4 [Chlamydiales bacterium]
MSTLKKYNLKGEQLGDVAIEETFLNVEANPQMIKDYIVAVRANARQWSASTKTRAEVKATNKKPHPQKKLGRARQGSLVSPQFRGGGVVFGPRPKFDQHVRINKKERRLAIRKLISEKMKDGNAIILEDDTLGTPQTKTVAGFIKALDLKGKILFLSDSQYDEVEGEGQVTRVTVSSDKHDNFVKSISNIQNTAFSLASNVSGYDVTWARNIVITEKALPELKSWLERQ